jgi:hypothetical protein
MTDSDILEPSEGQLESDDEPIDRGGEVLFDRGEELMERGEDLIVGGDELMERGEELMATLRDELHLHYQEQAEQRQFMSDLIARFERTTEAQAKVLAEQTATQIP